MDPVGVAITTPSHPKLLSGRPSTSMATSTIFSRLPFSTEASFRAQSWCSTRRSLHTCTSMAIRSSTV